MTDHHRPLLERLAQLDPASPERIMEIAHDAEQLRGEITSTEVDELAPRRRLRGRRVASAVAAAIVAVALIVPLAILLPLAGNEDARDPLSPASEPVVTASETIEVLAPSPDARISSPVTVRGTADVFEATVSIQILDGTNNVIADTFTTATCGSGCRGDFRAEVPFSVGARQAGVIKVFEVSAKDGAEIDVVRIPVTLVPGPDDPIAAEIEQVWYDGARAVPTGERNEPLELQFLEGPDHCGGRRSRSCMSRGRSALGQLLAIPSASTCATRMACWACRSSPMPSSPPTPRKHRTRAAEAGPCGRRHQTRIGWSTS